MKTFTNPLYKSDDTNLKQANLPNSNQKKINSQYMVQPHMIIQQTDESVSQLRITQSRMPSGQNSKANSQNGKATPNSGSTAYYNTNNTNSNYPGYRGSTNQHPGLEFQSKPMYGGIPSSHNNKGQPNTNLINMDKILSSETGESSRLQDSLLNNYNANIDHLSMSD